MCTIIISMGSLFITLGEESGRFTRIDCPPSLEGRSSITTVNSNLLKKEITANYLHGFNNQKSSIQRSLWSSKPVECGYLQLSLLSSSIKHPTRSLHEKKYYFHISAINNIDDDDEIYGFINFSRCHSFKL